MFELDIVEIIISLMNVLLMGIFLVKECLAIKKSGKTIVKRKNLILMVFVVGTVILLVGILDYSDSKVLNVADIIHILFMAVCSRQIVSFSSSKIYTIYENGVNIDFGNFLKWEDIDGYEWDHEFLKLKVNKQGVIRKIKIKPENIEKIQDIIEKNQVLAFI